jgi:hypothetical protein
MLEDLLLGLQKIGLDEKEGRIYLALLSKPGSSAQDVAERADLPRGTCYDLLSDLVERGFALVGEGESKRYFPQSPDELLSLLRIEEKKIAERIVGAQSFVPMLTVLYNPTGPKPRVRYKEGIKGLRELQKEYATIPDDILQIVGLDAFLSVHDPAVTAEHRGEIDGGKRKIRSLFVTDDPSKIPKLQNMESRRLSPEFVNVMGEMTVCGDRVAFFSYEGDMVALEIHSPAIAGTCRATLELAWAKAGELEKVFEKD